MDEFQDEIDRREFLKLMGASLALAGLSACTRMPAEKIIPYLEQPSQLIPGESAFYASSIALGGFAKGVLVESIDARPIKVEGNALHPDSKGATDIFTQAAVLSLYDPERSKSVIHRGSSSDWNAFERGLSEKSQAWAQSGGEGVRILTETVTSPTLGREIQKFLEKYPKARWHQYEPLNPSLTRRATELAFGRDLRPSFRFEKADVVVSLDYDFLGPGPGQQAYARAFMSRRRPESGSVPNRLSVIETNLSVTGAVADDRFALRPSELLPFALALGRELRLSNLPDAPISDGAKKRARRIAAELKAHAGRSLVVAGPQQDFEVQLLAFALNAHLKNQDQTIHYIDPPESASVDQFQSLEELTAEMRAGRVGSLVILGANPVYSAPKRLELAEALSKVSFRVRLGLFEDETSVHCDWHLPEAHVLESWGDLRAFDGTISLQQPLIAPLYDGRSALEVMASLNGEPGLSGYQILKSVWSDSTAFKTAIHDGVFKDSAFQPRMARLRPNWARNINSHSPPKSPQGIEVKIIPDPTIWDGRFANNAWLQELPKPMTQLTWDNAALIGPDTATHLGVKTGDVIRLSFDGRAVKSAAYVLPGHAEKAVTLSMGYGRTRAGAVGNAHGYDVYELQHLKSPYWIEEVKVDKTLELFPLADTQAHHKMEGRELAMHHAAVQQASLLPDYPADGEAWAMVIDLNVCIGCKVCTIACQAENNIPVVGKSEVLNSREMHWIRVDRYFEGDPKDPKTYFQPVPCMHCEKAPCEYVCPTVATNHSSDGLNQMVYNRCVGTRYCSNNCPYKVRRFNFFEYAKQAGPNRQLGNNPDVTVRSRGVMEKCTYCVQRIQEARIAAEKEGRPLRDGDVVTACQGACPTNAIVFGDKNDPKSEVSRLRASPRNFSLLEELGTKPRTTYLARVENPRPEGGA